MTAEVNLNEVGGENVGKKKIEKRERASRSVRSNNRHGESGNFSV